MNVYLRKLFPHDLTHEVSIRENIIVDFFKGKKEGITFYKEGDANRLEYPIKFFKSKDSRFSNNIKHMYMDDDVHEGDILIIREIGDDMYSLSIAKTGTQMHDKIKDFFDYKERHLIIDESFIY